MRTAARVVPTTEPAASTCSSELALVFTPVVPVEHVAADRESGATSSSRCRQDGQEYVSQPPSPMRSSLQSGTPLPFRSEMWDAAFYMHSTVEASSSPPNEPALANPERAASAVPAGASASLKPIRHACCIHTRDVAKPLADSVIGA